MPRFQFTLRNLLWATFWVAVSAAAWSLAARFLDEPKFLVDNDGREVRGSDGWPVPNRPRLSTLFYVLVGTASPCIAMGLLIGKARSSAVIGAALGILAAVMAFFAWALLIFDPVP